MRLFIYNICIIDIGVSQEDSFFDLLQENVRSYADWLLTTTIQKEK